jgi:phage terminase large subunit GpA-like protein
MDDERFATARRSARHALTPPARLQLSKWIEKEILLPSSMAVPGRVRLYKYQRGIADAISDPSIEKITVVKGIRVGFTTLVTSAIANYIVNDPSTIMVLLPTESDARSYVVNDVEAIFAASPALRDVLDSDASDRNTLMSRHYTGGFLMVLSAQAPHNMRGHNIRVLFCDEVDGYEPTSEGSAVHLGIGRTMSYPNRKIVIGSTPKDTDTSAVLASYRESDQRIFEVCTACCGAFVKIEWKHIVWPEGQPEFAKFKCPHCDTLLGEEHKAKMVEAGQWRATKPEVKKHAGFIVDPLVSLHANASWSVLAPEFIAAKRSPATLRVFVNQILAQGWETPSMIDNNAIAARAENFDLNHLPAEVIALTCGVDVQDDRLELVVCGWSDDRRSPECFVIHHRVIYGSFTNPQTWVQLDEFLLSRFRHPAGGVLGIDGCIVDAGDGDHSGIVMDFANSKDRYRHIWAGKGYWGMTRARFKISKEVKSRFAIIGVDALKGELFDKLQQGRGIRFSHSLEAEFYQQLASEHRTVRMKGGIPVRRFERVSGKARAEALDSIIYATAAMIDIWRVMPFGKRLAQLKMPGGFVPKAALEPPTVSPEVPDPAEYESSVFFSNAQADRELAIREKVDAENRARWAAEQQAKSEQQPTPVEEIVDEQTRRAREYVAKFQPRQPMQWQQPQRPSWLRPHG